jgi:hypothetical protein
MSQSRSGSHVRSEGSGFDENRHGSSEMAASNEIVGSSISNHSGHNEERHHVYLASSDADSDEPFPSYMKMDLYGLFNESNGLQDESVDDWNIDMLLDSDSDLDNYDVFNDQIVNNENDVFV